MQSVMFTKDIIVGDNNPLVIIAGPCVLEDFDIALLIARELKKITNEFQVPYIFKASYDKANRSSLNSFRGPGIDKGLEMLARIKKEADVPLLTDVHSPQEVAQAAKVVDVLQIPAFLCRQTDLVVSAAESGKAVNIKKGQFLAPWDMKNSVDKCYACGNRNITVTERGTTFGYNNLVNDMRTFPILRGAGIPVIYDATHSVQLPGGQGTSSGGQREFIRYLSRSAVAAGCDGLFFECHPEPDKALCDGPNSLALDSLRPILRELKAIDDIVKGRINYEK
ncbi:MAG: 3-deoxy-8-phosphooctulonate synthase [Candidatus Auribacter fodinae]|uniref:2-dehydro-3-deoxyphosphooctonate aldolase n=1 Tax=Candidatus Auribacter fodinae TaxID=2093366 RepID=A0A3A4R930_9BACT|nr:MAG: 3-deoxy-8-phosphooctulonate synthase [Candidatus Auribacter fodinae]